MFHAKVYFSLGKGIKQTSTLSQVLRIEDTKRAYKNCFKYKKSEVAKETEVQFLKKSFPNFLMYSSGIRNAQHQITQSNQKSSKLTSVVFWA